jgi:hypothetical protein
MAAIVVRTARILLFEVAASRSGDLPSWSSSDMAIDDHPFFFTLDPVLDEHPHARIGVGALLSQNVRGRGAC